MTSDGRPDLRDVIEHYLGAHAGRRMIPCPLHEDRSPSCSVNYDLGLWHCHSCGRGGSSWDLIMSKEGCSFKEAVAVAEKYGLEHGRPSEGRSRVRARDRRGRRRTYRPRFGRSADE